MSSQWFTPKPKHACSDHWPDAYSDQARENRDMIWQCDCGKYYRMIAYREKILWFNGPYQYDWVQCTETGEWPVATGHHTLAQPPLM